MKKKLILLLFIPFAVFSQENSQDSLHQEIIMSVLQQINEYKSSISGLSTGNRSTQFKNLFVDLNTKVVNDIPAIGNYDEKISVEDYVSKMRMHYEKIGVDIKIHEISAINFEADNKGSLSVFITKKVRGENARYEINDEYVEYKDAFDLEVKFIFNDSAINISEIVLTKKKGKLLVIAPHWKTFFSKTLHPKYEMRIKIDGEEIQLSGYYYSIADITADDKIEIISNDGTLIGGKTISLKTYENTNDNHVFKILFSKTIGDIQGFVILSSSKVKVNTNSYNTSVSDNSPQAFGGAIAFNIDKLFSSTGKKFSTYVKLGVISESFDYEISIPEFSETFSDIDADGGVYDRTVVLNNFTENQLIDMQTIFGQVEGRFKTPKFGNFKAIGSISLGMGKVIINSATYSNSAQASYSGYYDDLFGITMAENGVYNFGQFNLSQFGDLDHTNVWALLGDVSGSLKYKDRWMVSAGIMYTQYQSNIFNLGTDRISYEDNEFDPSIEDELNTINNLIDVDMSHLSLKVGISYKF